MIDEALRARLRERLIFDAGDGRGGYVMPSRSGGYLRLSTEAHLILSELAEGVPVDALAERLSATGASVTAGSLQDRVRRLLARIDEIDARGHRLRGFWLRTPLLAGRPLATLAGALSPAFDARTAACVLVAWGLGLLGALRSPPLAFGAADLLIGYGLFLMSLAVHELGHAAALARQGSAPREIGFVAYLIYPAFYSDVTDAWRLPRVQRVLVDIGGIYLQCAFAALLGVMNLVTPSSPLAAAMVLIALSVLVSLNPFLRFDGYWIVLDALGLTGLAGVRRELLAWLRPGDHSPPRRSKWRVPVLAAYAALAPIAWTYFLITVGPFLLDQLLAYPALIAATVEALLTRTLEWRLVIRLATGTFLALAGAVLGIQFVAITLGAVRAALRWSRTRAGSWAHLL